MKSLLIAVLLSVSFLSAHEVPMHVQITLRAMDYLIASLSDKPDEQKQFQLCKQRILDLLIGTDANPGGVVQEDDGYGNRFMFHFNPQLRDEEDGFAVLSNCTSLDWAFTTSVARIPTDIVGDALSKPCQHNFALGVLGGDRDDQDGIVLLAPPVISLQNRHTWEAALAAGKDSKGVEAGWRHLGYILHLLQDETSPAHVRSDAHPHKVGTFPDADPLEYAEFLNKVPLPAMPAQLLNTNLATSAQDLFLELRDWTQSSFYSKDTLFVYTTKGGDELLGPVFADVTDEQFVIDPDLRKIAFFAMAPSDFADKLATARQSSDALYAFARNYASIDPDVMPLIQWAELGPQAVKYTAQLVYRYYKDIGGHLPCSGCYQFSGKFLTNPQVGSAPWLANGSSFEGRLQFDALAATFKYDAMFYGPNNPVSWHFFPASGGGSIDVTIGPYEFSSAYQGDKDRRTPGAEALQISWVGMPNSTNYIASDVGISKQPVPSVPANSYPAMILILSSQANLFDGYYRSPFPPIFSADDLAHSFGLGAFAFSIGTTLVNTGGKLDAFGACQNTSK